MVRAFNLNLRVPEEVVSPTRSLGISLGVPVCLDAALASSSARVRLLDSQNSWKPREAEVGAKRAGGRSRR